MCRFREWQRTLANWRASNAMERSLLKGNRCYCSRLRLVERAEQSGGERMQIFPAIARGAQHEDRDSVTPYGLLESQIPVNRHGGFEATAYRSGQQRAIPRAYPAHARDRCDRVVTKVEHKATIDALVEEYLYAADLSARSFNSSRRAMT